MITTLTLFAALRPSSAVPPISLSDPPRHETTNCADAVDLRTAEGIVLSCLATIFACTWVAIHPNLPDPRISGWSRFKQRTGIMILAVFAPEFILIWALRQRIGAGSIMREYNRTILGLDKGKKSLILRAREWFSVPPPPPNDPVWTFTHGFYAQMGGFLLYNKDTAVRVLHFRELQQLVQLGAVDRPNVTEEDICDRSKGDFLTKSLVVVQTTWFIFQCIARWAAKLPVTELEIMTLSFAVLNIITYWLWWDKPQNVYLGVRVQLKEGAMFRLRVADWHRNLGTTQTTMVRTTGERQSGTPSTTPGTEEMNFADPYKIRVPGLPLGIRDMLSELAIRPETPIQHDLPPHRTPRSRRANHTSLWSRIIAAAGRLLHSISGGILKPVLFFRLREVALGPVAPIQGMGAPRVAAILTPGTLKIGTFYAYDSALQNQRFGLVLFWVASGALFGGLHLIPWKFTFPTDSESLLWRISALYITLNPVLVSIPLLFCIRFHYVGAQEVSYYAALRWALYPFRLIAATVPFYILARILILVLAFVTLRSLPPGAYQDIPWSSFIPHI